MTPRPEPRTTGRRPRGGLTIAVVGSRSWPDESFVHAKLDELLRHSVSQSFWDSSPRGVITALVSGGASGVDQMAARWAVKNGLYRIEHLPEWDRLRKRAGFVRNQYIIEDADMVVAFMVRGSRGTQLSVDIAKRMEKPLTVYTETDLPEREQAR